MRISTDGLSADGGHTLLKQVIVPRPIAWITTLRPNGVVNLAPFSCYSFICFQPMLLCLSFERVEGTYKKDTLSNIERTRELVVHPVTEDLVELANATARTAPPDESKLVTAGLSSVPGDRIATPRIAECAIAMECVAREIRPIVERHDLVIAEVVLVHVRDDLVLPDGTIDVERYHPVGRMSGDRYVRLRDVFELARPWLHARR